MKSSRWVRQWRSSSSQHGWVAIGLHWVSALLIIGLLALGIWMVTLSYYSQWYHPAPHLHKSFGMLFAAILLFRFIWRLINHQPEVQGKAWERQAAHYGHRVIYLLLMAIVVSGYLLVTAEGAVVSVFDWLDIPASPIQFERQADIAGWWHRWLSYLLIACIALHIAAALKHQLIDRDGTLSRMLGRIQ